jgi:FlaG/FlaF family flagellin (archaellin)
MRNLKHPRSNRGLIIAGVAVFVLAFASLPLRSSARVPATSVNIVNNSGRGIIHVYLSHVGSDDWSGNQLPDSTTIASGGSYALSNVACDQQQGKVIAEDQDGCFLSTIISCGDSGTWTITNESPKDCGY